MTNQNKKNRQMSEWDNLYEFVRSKVMDYDQNQSLSKEMVLRLKGLLTNKFMENKAIKDSAHYSFVVVLNTFKFCMLDIEKAKYTKTFANEMHKFNYFLCIVESKLNDVYKRMQASEKAKEKIDNSSTEIIEKTNNATYQTRSSKDNAKFDDMW